MDDVSQKWPAEPLRNQEPILEEAIPAGRQSREVRFAEKDARQSRLLAEQELRRKDDGRAVVLGYLSVEEERDAMTVLILGFFCWRLDLDQAVAGRDNLDVIALSSKGADQGHRIGHHARPKI